MEGINIKATAHVKLVKLDENGQATGVIEHDVELSKEEAESLWRSQTQE